MSGKAVLVLVVGIIIVAATVLFNIEAASTRIVRNFSDYYVRQTTRNLAQSGVNLALTEMGRDREWRTGFPDLQLLDGTVSVRLFDTEFQDRDVVAIMSIGETRFSSSVWRRDTCIAYVNVKGWDVVPLKGLLTLNATTGINGNATIDGRNHDTLMNVIPGSGIEGIWTTKPSFSISGSGTVGGTDTLGNDYAPSNPADPNVLLTNQSYPMGYPTNPDQILHTYTDLIPNGTLKAIAQSGFEGSQYSVDGTDLKYPLRGVTYVETPATTPQNEWRPADVPGSGILVVHNSAGNAKLVNTKGDFRGLIIADEVEHFHGGLLGGMIAIKNMFSGNVVGNGDAWLYYSEQTIIRGTQTVARAIRPHVLGWWE